MEKFKSYADFTYYVIKTHKIDINDDYSICNINDFAIISILNKCIKYNKIKYFKDLLKYNINDTIKIRICKTVLGEHDKFYDNYYFAKYCYIYKNSNLFEELSDMLSLKPDNGKYCNFAFDIYMYFKHKKSSSYYKKIEQIILKTTMLLNEQAKTEYLLNLSYDAIILLNIYKKYNKPFYYLIDNIEVCKVNEINKNSILYLKNNKDTIYIGHMINIIYSLLLNKIDLIEICTAHEYFNNDAFKLYNVAIFKCILLFYTLFEFDLDKLQIYFDYLSTYLKNIHRDNNILYLIVLLEESTKYIYIDGDEYDNIALSIINNNSFYTLSGNVYNKVKEIFNKQKKNKLEIAFCNKIIELNINNTTEFNDTYSSSDDELDFMIETMFN